MTITGKELELLRLWATGPRNGPETMIPASYSSDEAVLNDEKKRAEELRGYAARENRYDQEGAGGLEPIVRQPKRNRATFTNNSNRGSQKSLKSGTIDHVLFSAIFSGSQSSSVRSVHAYLTELAQHQQDVFHSEQLSDYILSVFLQAKRSISLEPSNAQKLLLRRLEVIATVAFEHLNARPAFSLFVDGNHTGGYLEAPISSNSVRHRMKPPFVYSICNGSHHLPDKPANVNVLKVQDVAPARYVSPTPLPTVVYDSVFGAAVIPRTSRR